MLTSKTQTRRRTKREWLLANPAVHEWLSRRRKVPVREWAKDAEALAIVDRLRRDGLYSAKTVDVDICSAIRNAAVKLDVLTAVRAAAERLRTTPIEPV